MSKILKKYIEDDAIDGSKIKLANNEPLRADSAITGEKDVIKINTNDFVELGTTQAYLPGDDRIMSDVLRNIPNGFAGLDAGGKVAAAQLPSYVDDVEEYADFASLPATGETGKIYVTLDDNKTYRWSGSAYVEISSGPADTDALAEGSTNFYYTEARFNASLAGKSTTDLAEGSNLYHTDARARTAAVVNSTAGTETDQAASVASMKTYVAAQVAGATANSDTEVFTLNATDISNGYVDLAQTPSDILDVTPKGGVKQEEAVDYTISTNRVTFAGDLSTLLADGDKLMITYLY